MAGLVPAIRVLGTTWESWMPGAIDMRYRFAT
jgi:hypothetical protein